MLYNRCTGIYKLGNNTYPRHIRRRANLGHIFRGKKSASYGPGNTVYIYMYILYMYIYILCIYVFMFDITLNILTISIYN